jgi:hypothetical protein
MSRHVLLFGGLILVLACCRVADAQRRVPNYRNRPAISPYVGLFQGANGGLNSYFYVVRPRQVVQQEIQAADYAIERQQLAIEQRAIQLQQELQDTLLQPGGGGPLQLRPTTSATGMRRTAGTFMNYSAFYRQGGPQITRGGGF